MNCTVIKLGGSVLVNDELRHRLVGQIAALVREGQRLILVHGGGKQIARMLDALRIESRFHEGLRVTDAAARDVVQMVLSGLVGRNLVAELGVAGVPAVSLTGGDGRTFLADKMNAPDGVDLGFVGQITVADSGLIDRLLDAGYTPVIACLGLGREDSQYYNVNGDQMASAVAGGCRATRLILVTDVGGVNDENGRQIAELTPAGIDHLLASGVAGGGMRPKLRSCLEALAAGVSVIRIVGASEPEVLWRTLHDSEPLGTTIHQ